MNFRRIQKLERILDQLYDHIKSERKETIIHLGDKDALHIIDFHANNWIDIIKWINSKYNKNELSNITILQFSRLFKEIYWLQLLFHYCNYPTIFRNLRYILELICQAYYIDSRYSDLNLDEQIRKIKEKEKEPFGWKLVEQVLCEITNKKKQHIYSKYKQLWNNLNKYVHPSIQQLDTIAKEDLLSLVTDSFNEKFARDALIIIDKIFDIINMIIIKRFPRITPLINKYEFLEEWKEFLPNTLEIIKNN